MTDRRTQKVPRLAPLCRGHEETKRLAATHTAVDVDRLLQAIRLAGGAFAISAKAGEQKNVQASLESAPNQQVGSAATQSHVAPGEESSATFSRFPKFVPELRSMIWQQAIGDSRLIYVHLGIPGTGTVAAFDSFIMNRSYLADADNARQSLWSTCMESRDEVRRIERLDGSKRNWLGRLGITQFRPTSADLVYMGGLHHGERAPPRDMNKIIPLSLVLGNILSAVMVNADVFVKYFDPDPNREPENPTDKALADLRTLGNQYAPFFDDDSDGLPQPRLPESMVFMLGNFHQKWNIASPCTVPEHREEFITSCCIHYDHLEIIDDEDMDGWMDSELVHYDEDSSRDRQNWRVRMEIVPAIRAIFAGWRSQPNLATPAPRLFFARIKPSE